MRAVRSCFGWMQSQLCLYIISTCYPGQSKHYASEEQMCVQVYVCWEVLCRCLLSQHLQVIER
jgi:hypothetical protein